MEMMEKGYSTWGVFAHVDAGKTTLTESILYEKGLIKSLGRVDKGDAFLDYDAMEKARGITIFSKQVQLAFDTTWVTLLDTPGHVDFSGEMERTLPVLDGAILVINGSQGIQSHTKRLWSLLQTNQIPTIIFVNKMDQNRFEQTELMELFRNTWSSNFVNFSNQEQDRERFLEEIALTDEAMLEHYLTTDTVEETAVYANFWKRKFCPVWFGSALKMEGITSFLRGWNGILSGIPKAEELSKDAQPKKFGAFVYKIGREEKGERITFLKITQGTLEVRQTLGEEKITSIRQYHGTSYETLPCGKEGMIVGLTGLQHTYAGQSFGDVPKQIVYQKYSVVSYEVILPEQISLREAVPQWKKIEEEMPELQVSFQKEGIEVQLMGQLQKDIVKKLVEDRYGYVIQWGKPKILYQETLQNKVVEGVGHFEPLRHYAEVHLLLEPLELGSGLVFANQCKEDELDKNWQQLIMTHLREKAHLGVLIGAPITDVKITLVGGRAHKKHTEGGDFRQATYRAVRQGLMQGESELLEPMYQLELVIPQEYLGKAMQDISLRNGKEISYELTEELAVVTAKGPVATFAEYGNEVALFTKGQGKLEVSIAGYEPCHNREEIIIEKGYSPTSDVENTPDSVFCQHGAGVNVSWNQVHQWMHLPSYLKPTKKMTDQQVIHRLQKETTLQQKEMDFVSAEEIESIFGNLQKNQGKDKKKNNWQKTKGSLSGEKIYKGEKLSQQPEYILVDGYNIIFAWEELKAIAKDNIDGARGALQDILCDYQAMVEKEIIIVYDAYKRQEHKEECLDYLNIHIVFTKTAETADHYIEAFTQEHGKKYHITVATSDGLEQMIVRGAGARLFSAREFYEEIQQKKAQFKEKFQVK